VVLAKRSDSDYEPWVTWRIDEMGNTVHGHYFRDLVNASLDLYTRAGLTVPA
jgi:hypothetical protein